MYTINQVAKAIDKAKARLIAKAEKKGITENFGQDEVRKLRDKYCTSDWYAHYHDRYASLNAANLVQEFCEWCMTFSLYEQNERI